MSDARIEDRLEGATGHYVVEVIRDTGRGPEVIHRSEGRNMVLNTGKKQTWRQTSGLSTRKWNWFQLGTNSAAVTSTNTGVKTQVAASIKTASLITMSGRTLQLVVSYPSGGGSLSAANIKEFHVQNTVGSAAMTNATAAICRALISPVVNKTTADKLKITYQIRIT